MEPKFKFEKLVIWQKAMDFGEDINTITSNFPKKELYNLNTQICRAADSIALNISEGSIGQTNAEQKRFIAYAIRSLAETITCLHKAIRRKYMNPETFQTLYDEGFHLMNMLIKFKKSIN